MSNIVEAEYQVIQERTLPVIASEILQIEENACRVAMDAAIRIGERLKEAKGIAGHGSWAQWCDENLNYSQKKAERFMKIYEEYGDENSPYLKSTTLSKLSISKALSLLDIPKNEVKTFAETHDIEALSVRELEEEIKKLKAEKMDAEALKEETIELKKELEELREAGVDTEKIEALESKLKKQEEKYKKLAEDLKAEKETRAKAVSEALEKEKAQLMKQAEDAAEVQLQEVRKENEELEEKLERLAKRIENSANENTLVFKLRVDQLQEVFAECMACAEAETDPEMQGKMKNALSAVMDNLRGGM